MMGFLRRRAPTCTLRSTRSERLTLRMRIPRSLSTLRAKSAGDPALFGNGLLERLSEHSPLVHSQRDSSQRCQGRRDICGCGLGEIFSRPNPESHEKKGHALVVVVGGAVACAGMAL